MPDISMCSNKECKFGHMCHRLMAIPNEYGQSYGSFKPSSTDCKYFIKIHKNDNIRGRRQR